VKPDRVDGQKVAGEHRVVDLAQERAPDVPVALWRGWIPAHEPIVWLETRPTGWRSAPSHPLRSFRPAAGAQRRERCAVLGVCAPATSGALAEPAAARCRGPDSPGARSRARADARSHTGRHDSRDSALRVNRRIDRESHSIPIHAIHLPATLPISPRRGKFDQPRAVRLRSRHPNNHSNERAEL
jgi:hypothetical protein